MNNGRLHVNIDLINKIKNNRLKRAFELFYLSFDSNVREVRYVLLFSVLECLFNLNGKSISTKMASYTSKIVTFFDKKRYFSTKKEIKRLYGKRSSYIHGSKSNHITKGDEKELRVIVRRVLLIYYLIQYNHKYSNKKMLEYIRKGNKIDLNDKLYLKSLLSNNFKEQQEGILDIIKEEVEVPKEFEEKTLSAVKQFDNY